MSDKLSVITDGMLLTFLSVHGQYGEIRVLRTGNDSRSYYFNNSHKSKIQIFEIRVAIWKQIVSEFFEFSFF